jgi:regulator of ribonuclease activity A
MFAIRDLILPPAVRCRTAHAKRDIGITALGITPCRSVRPDIRDLDVAIGTGGGSILPGDRVFADMDGIDILSPDAAEGTAS